MEKSNLQILTNGIIKENPVLVLVLGTCPTMAVTTMAKNGIGMGLAATFVLLGSNIVISLLKKIIPDKVRIPCYIVVIAGFVTLLSALLQDVYKRQGGQGLHRGEPTMPCTFATGYCSLRPVQRAV